MFEFDILAIYWYSGRLLCAALKNNDESFVERENLLNDLPSFTNSKWDTKDGIGTIFF